MGTNDHVIVQVRGNARVWMIPVLLKTTTSLRRQMSDRFRPELRNSGIWRNFLQSVTKKNWEVKAVYEHG